MTRRNPKSGMPSGFLPADLEVELLALGAVAALVARPDRVGAGLGDGELAGELATGLADDLLLARLVLEVTAGRAALELDLDLPAAVGRRADRARVGHAGGGARVLLEGLLLAAGGRVDVLARTADRERDLVVIASASAAGEDDC